MRVAGLISIIVVLWSWMPPVAEAADVEVLALFGDKAIIRVDGTQYRLARGETTPEGFTLVSHDTRGANLKFNGKTKFYRLGARARANNRAPQSVEVQIWRDMSGMYRTTGSINGLPVNFLVDTGATYIAMNEADARRLGIDFRVVGEPSMIMTASQLERVYRVKLNRVKVGAIELRNVDAVVMNGPQPARMLLGMSFLGRLDMRNVGDQLILRRTF